MTKSYILTTSVAAGLQAAVFASGAMNPMDSLLEVEHELAAKQVTGKVVFDMLLTNGHKQNRYYVAEFDGKKFHDGFSEMSSSHEGLAALSAGVLKENYEDISPVLCSPAVRFALRKGVAI